MSETRKVSSFSTDVLAKQFIYYRHVGPLFHTRHVTTPRPSKKCLRRSRLLFHFPISSIRRFALNPTPSVTATYLNDAIVDAEDARCDVEVSPASGALVQKVAQLVAKGGVALIADYGHEGSKTDTLRGFKGHKLWDPLEVRLRLR